jgi:hypothetical protein
LHGRNLSTGKREDKGGGVSGALPQGDSRTIYLQKAKLLFDLTDEILISSTNAIAKSLCGSIRSFV